MGLLSDVQTKPLRIGNSDQSSDRLNQLHILLQILSNVLLLNRKLKSNPCHNSRLYNHVILPLLLVASQLRTRGNPLRTGKGI